MAIVETALPSEFDATTGAARQFPTAIERMAEGRSDLEGGSYIGEAEVEAENAFTGGKIFEQHGFDGVFGSSAGASLREQSLF